MSTDQFEVVNLHPATMPLAKIIMGFGAAGLILWLSPWAPESLLFGLILPILLCACVFASIGLAGQGFIDLYNTTSGTEIARQVTAALRQAKA